MMGSGRRRPRPRPLPCTWEFHPCAHHTLHLHFADASLDAISSKWPAANKGSPRMSGQPHYVAFKEQPASSPSPGGSSNHHEEPGLQVAVGALIEHQELVDWSAHLSSLR